MAVDLSETREPVGKRKLELIAVYLPKQKKEALEKWAASKERSISWVVGKLIDKALQERGLLDIPGSVSIDEDEDELD